MSAVPQIADMLLDHVVRHPRWVKSFTPHFATGLAVRGFLDWRRRKAAVAR